MKSRKFIATTMQEFLNEDISNDLSVLIIKVRDEFVHSNNCSIEEIN